MDMTEMTSSDMRQLLLKIWEDNDYVLTFQATPEIRAVSDELKRVWSLTEIAAREWKSTDLEPLLGCLTEFIADLDNDIAKRYELLCGGNADTAENEEDNEEHAGEEDNQIHYLKTIKSATVKSRDRVVEWQLEMIKK